MSTTHTTIDSPIGELILVADGATLRGVYFPGHWTRPDPATFGERSQRGLEQVE
jgi:methylated-DNA-[protein]-cysteine S-methyltransferase